MLSLKDIMETLLNFLNTIGSDFRIGIAGSYARNEATETSDLDVVIDGDSMKQEIADKIKKLFPITVDVLWLDLLRNEDKELDLFCKANGFPINEDSVYKTVLREVIWIEDKSVKR